MTRTAATILLLALATSVGCTSEDEGAPPYPGGPYGLVQGDVMANLLLVDAAGEPVQLGAFYQDEASALLLYVTATWCFTCGPEINWLNDYPPRVDRDLVAMSVLLQNKQFENATTADAQAFSTGYDAQFPTVIDPSGQLDALREEAFIPLNLLVDTSTMHITLRETGFSQASLEQAIASILETPQ